MINFGLMREIKIMFIFFFIFTTGLYTYSANYVLSASALSYCAGGGVSIYITGDYPPNGLVCTLYKNGLSQESVTANGAQPIHFTGTYTAGEYSTNIGTNNLTITENPLPANLNSTNGLVAYYPFNNNANDASGHGNNGTIYGATAVTDRDLKEKGAYQFNGSTNYILIGSPVPASLQIQNEITLSAWIYATSYPASNTLSLIVGSQCDNCGQSGATIFLDGRTNTDGMINPAGHIHFQIGNGTWHQSNSMSQVPLNQWVHIAATRKANEVAKIYYNGVSQPLTSTAWPEGTIRYVGTDFSIGRQKDYSNRFFNGKIDEVRVYNRALSETEVKALYQDMVVAVSSDTICSNSSATISLNHPESGMTYQLIKDNVETGTPQTGAGIPLVFSTDNINSTSHFGLKSTNLTSGCTVMLDTVLTIAVNPLPTVTLAPLGNYINIHANAVSLSGSPTGGAFSGAGISGSTFHPAIAGLGRKTISYNYTNTSGCSSVATQTTIVYDTTGVVCNRYDTTYISVTDTLYIDNIITGLTAPDNLNSIKIFPNPTKDYITIDYGNYNVMNGYILKITNSVGQEVYNATINQPAVTLNLSGWTGKGIYTVRLKNSENKIISTKVIVIN